jgi:mRNA interferase MazF
MGVLKGKFIPQKGDIVSLDFSPTSGREQSGFRPALIISSSRYNQLSGLCLALPITSKEKGLMFELVLPKNLTTKGVIICDQVRTISYKTRKVKFLEKTDLSFCEEAVQMMYAVCR